ncbi:MAG: aldo/keto reductase [Caenispirillum sp.]|nr:aldo/keto reductase [Caenispirillum sp.]
MQTTTLGRSGLSVSRLCLGTMNFGASVDEAAAHAQLDMAVEAGITFLDTAELYPSPPDAGSFGATEAMIGRWLAARGSRDKVVIATKATGRSRMPWLRPWEGGTRLDARNIEAAVEGSLRRLGTDVIDLYQLHWPDRKTNIFGQLGYTPAAKDDPVPLEETLDVLGRLVEAGKIRAVGLCNETPWGVMTALALAEAHGLPRVASVQNPCNLLNRTFEIGLAEIAHREDVGLLAYAPLSMGMLTGKYLGGARPAGSRLSKHRHFARFLEGEEAAARYAALAREHGMEPATLALAWVLSRPFTASVLIGATSPEQLRRNIAAAEVTLSDEVIAAIDAIHADHPNPVP